MSKYLEGDWHRPIIEGLLMPPAPRGIYIEVGVRGCETISQVLRWCKEAHAVDIDSSCENRLPPGVYFWNMDSDTFFNTYPGPPADVIFIDADHTEDQTARDFRNAVKCLAPNGVIALHDTWPYVKGEFWHGYTETVNGAWKVAQDIEGDPTFSAVTIPRFPGLTLVRKNGD